MEEIARRQSVNMEIRPDNVIYDEGSFRIDRAQSQLEINTQRSYSQFNTSIDDAMLNQMNEAFAVSPKARNMTITSLQDLEIA